MFSCTRGMGSSMHNRSPSRMRRSPRRHKTLRTGAVGCIGRRSVASGSWPMYGAWWRRSRSRRSPRTWRLRASSRRASARSLAGRILTPRCHTPITSARWPFCARTHCARRRCLCVRPRARLASRASRCTRRFAAPSACGSTPTMPCSKCSRRSWHTPACASCCSRTATRSCKPRRRCNSRYACWSIPSARSRKTHRQARVSRP